MGAGSDGQFQPSEHNGGMESPLSFGDLSGCVALRGPDEDAVLKACQAIGSLMELWGFKRIHGVMWTFLYVHDRSMDAQELKEGLAISSGLVSMTVHDLIRWGVVTREPTPGTRRERYRAEPDIWGAVAKVLQDREIACLDVAARELGDAAAALSPEGSGPRHQIEELQGLSRLAAGLLATFLQAGTMDIRRLRRVQLGMGIAKLLRRSGKDL